MADQFSPVVRRHTQSGSCVQGRARLFALVVTNTKGGVGKGGVGKGGVGKVELHAGNSPQGDSLVAVVIKGKGTESITFPIPLGIEGGLYVDMQAVNGDADGGVELTAWLYFMQP